MRDTEEYLSADLLIDMVKAQLNIRKSNYEMNGEEIGRAMRFIGSGAPDTVWIDGKPTLRVVGIGVMLSLTLNVFPWHYAEYELWQRN